MLKPDDLHIFGIRHHGPGSARSLRRALLELKPDILLIEGPADATELLPYLADTEMTPPLALVSYRPDNPKRAAYFPFAVFSPEYQAICYGLEHNLPTRFMDLPQSVMMASTAAPAMPDAEPLKLVAQAAGYPSYERWWNALVEQRQDDREVFAGVLELIHALRDDLPPPPDDETEEASASRQLAMQREAYMRQAVRQARAEGYGRIAAICGAWHGPALAQLDSHYSPEEDRELLEPLHEVEVESAWVPWSYSRLAGRSGYGAGVTSPGWYHYVWAWNAGTQTADLSTGWLTRVATLLRNEGLSASSAHIIEAVRLSEALAALRGKAAPGLAELSEATQTVLCFGNALPLKLIQEKLIIGERMGAVSPDSPMVPLQRDLYERQRRLKLRAEPTQSTLSLDLRQDMHLARSTLLHRLRLLGIGWGEVLPTRGKGGSYRELWRLKWQPEFAILVIEANIWGNTVPDAAAAFAEDRADKAQALESLTQLLDAVILADLPETVRHVMQRLQNEAALSGDLLHMMAALPPLLRVLRYGNVRQTDKGSVREVLVGMLTRVCVGLSAICKGLGDEAASEVFDALERTNGVVMTLRAPDQTQLWQQALMRLSDEHDVHGLIRGRACRLLFDARALSKEALQVRLERNLNPASGLDAAALRQQAFWLEGFLKGSGLLLIHDKSLWALIDAWILRMAETDFIDSLPVLRRTFASFSASVRQQMTERAQAEYGPTAKVSANFNKKQAEAVLPLVGQLLGIDLESEK